jgi:hypothetical protein
MLPHMINHYKDIVDDIYVVVYRQHDKDGIVENIQQLGIPIYKVVTEPKFNWERVTELYNEVTSTKPQEWWIISDDDEFHIYPRSPRDIIKDAYDEGYTFITGGFVDRIGTNGEFPKVDLDTNIWTTFPNMGFFRYPMSGANPNKVVIVRGYVDVTPGQHYADFGDGWNSWGTSHPQRYPIDDAFVQVHHFKWDSTVLDRIKEVSEIEKDYTYWWEYKKMYNAIKDSGDKIDISHRKYYIEEQISTSIPSFEEYSSWDRVKQLIVTV